MARQHSGYRCHAIPFWWASINRRRAMGASLGAIGTARAQHHLRQILVTLNLSTLNQPDVIIADAAHRFDENGNLIHEPTRQLIQKLLENLVDRTRRISPAPVRTINLIILSSLREAGTPRFPEIFAFGRGALQIPPLRSGPPPTQPSPVTQ